jgi:hypothetical protein
MHTTTKPIIVLLLLPLWLAAASSIEQSPQDKLPLHTYLQLVGKQLDVFFTVEAAYSGNYSDVQLSQPVSMPRVPEDIQSAVFILTNALTNLTVTATATNARIYHIVDRRLLEPNNYAMNQVLDAIQYSGNAADFVTLVGQKAPGIFNQNLSLSAVSFGNGGTRISIDARKIQIRDALSEGVNLRGYSSYTRLIWTSVTSLETLKTPVQYHGRSSG